MADPDRTTVLPVSKRPPWSTSEHQGHALQHELEPGATLLTRYRVRELVARGGMGSIFRADDIKNERPVALKVARDRRAESGVDYHLCLVHEAHAMARVSHPNVTRVLDLLRVPRAEGDEIPVMVLDWVPGRPLDGVLADGPLRGRLAVDVTMEIARAMGAVHAAGLVHRDLKPSNVLVEQLDEEGPSLRLIDFGLSSYEGRAFGETSGGDDAPCRIGGADLLMGSPGYMAPECYTSDEASFSMDLFSLGVVAHEVFLGTRPPAASVRLHRSGHGDAEIEHAVRGRAPAAAQTLISSCLRWRPEDRISCVQEAIGLLEEAARQLDLLGRRGR